ncbi:hypothetical protein L2E82_45345 [Cichorium intybus]|uniref:Uncharacterized protein n=1 Tax=Cichorium intybus TaxID=13427 RepID=A0ACB8ZSU8_CICIN|nr:hypothetical protein L2E82_45345 [Cichorium intybus]
MCINGGPNSYDFDLSKIFFYLLLIMAIGTTFVITCTLMMIGFMAATQPQTLVTSEIDVKTFGAVGDGITDDSLAVNQAWDVACSSTGQFKLSAGNFLVQPLSFSGPCKAPTVVVTVIGTLKAPPKNKWINNTDTWLNFQHINNLVITGLGRFDGQGQSGWWDSCKETRTCENNPTALGFNDCNGLKLKSVTSINSPRNHISINACNGSIITNINIIAPKESPNTDGIDIANTNGVHVIGGKIGTGDDCIAINGGSFNIIVNGLFCGPGHGISVGSLGRNGATDVVSNVTVAGSIFSDTQNGVRIKTVPGGSGSASRITFSNIQMRGVQHPIILSQFYCPLDPTKCKDNRPVVKISGVTFMDINGTSSTPDAIDIKCSRNPRSCVGITLERINIQPINSSIKVASTCQNTQARILGLVFPPVVCTQPSFIMMPLDYDYDNSTAQEIATT